MDINGRLQRLEEMLSDDGKPLSVPAEWFEPGRDGKPAGGSDTFKD